MTDKSRKPGKPGAPLSTPARLRALGAGRVPRLRYGFFPPWSGDEALRLVFPFRRSWPLIIGLGIFLVLFSLPLLAVTKHVGPRDDSLFSLVFSLFHLLSGLGWAVGVGVIALLFLLLLLGREIVTVREGKVMIHLDLLCCGIGGEYPTQGIANLRRAHPDERAGSGWRGEHLAFDYYDVPVAFGSAVVEPRSSEILALLRVRLAGFDSEAPGEPPPEKVGPAMVADAHEHPPIPAPPAVGAAGRDPVELLFSSSLALLLANLVPLFGVWLLHWDIGEIMLIYWAESGIVAFYNILKMAVVGGWLSIFSSIFFVGHFGGFMVVHLLFIYTFFVRGAVAKSGIPVGEVVATFISLWPALLALLISHGISFRVNFLGRREFAGTTVRKLMGEPYGRIMIMHFTILLGGFVALALHSGLPALLLLIGSKSYADLKAHARQHR